MTAERSLDDVLARFFRAQSRPSGAPGLGPDGVARVARTLGLDLSRLDADERSAIEGTIGALGLRLDEDTLMALSQAFGRATGRMVDAEAEIVRNRLRDLPPDERAEALDLFLHAARPLTDRLVSTTHSLRLHLALQDALGEGLGEPSVPRRSIALVDHVGSTTWLREASTAQTSEFVDRLHDTAQTVCAGRGCAAVKFAGDGVYLSGPIASDVLGAALDAVAALDGAPPLRTRGGLAHGPLFRRAGDYFGYTVNLAARLAESARPGEVLAPAWVVTTPPPGVVAEPRRVSLRGLEGVFDVVALAPVR